MKKRNLLLLAGVAIAASSYCQENTVATGGEIHGAGGSASYSLGQVFYHTVNGDSVTAYQGVQQPYYISVISGLEEKSINLEMVAFPNPVNNVLNLSVSDYDGSELSYQLYSAQSKLIASESIDQSNTKVNMSGLAPGVYIISVVGEKKSVKTFRIIKK